MLIEDFNRITSDSQQRLHKRLDDPVAVAVAEEMAAKALAESRGWDWPSLSGYAASSNLELTRIEMRQHLRQWARVATRAFVDHLRHGGVDAQPHFEQRVIEDLKAQNASDAERRLFLKPKPRFTGLDGGKADR